MQYIKCQECVYNGIACRYKMVSFMIILYDLETFFNKVPIGGISTNSPYKCKIKINYECTSFSPKVEQEESNV